MTKKIENILSLNQVAKIVGRNPRTVRRWFLEEKIMPEPIYMNKIILGWRESVIAELILKSEENNRIKS
jgi:predicted DNA-binding transcriptional regulator AlpA